MISIKNKIHWPARLLLGLSLLVAANVQAVDVLEIRTWHGPERTRYVFDLSAAIQHKVDEIGNPNRLVIDITDGKFKGELPSGEKTGPYVDKVRFGQHEGYVRFVLDLTTRIRYKDFYLAPYSTKGHRLVIDIESTEKSEQVAASPVSNKFIVVIDAGHGGEDPGAIGKRKTHEKKVVLAIAKKLKKEIDAMPGMHAELTRTGDYYISLRKRTSIARSHKADLFISIHADAFHKRSAHGISVFALSDRGATSEEAKWLANKENSSDFIGGTNLGDYPDTVAQTLMDIQTSWQQARSLELGEIIRSELKKVGKVRGTQVHQAGFVVLKSPDIPSLLIETGFISNPGEENKLRDPAYQSKIAKGIARAIKIISEKYPKENNV